MALLLCYSHTAFNLLDELCSEDKDMHLGLKCPILVQHFQEPAPLSQLCHWLHTPVTSHWTRAAKPDNKVPCWRGMGLRALVYLTLHYFHLLRAFRTLRTEIHYQISRNRGCTSLVCRKSHVLFCSAQVTYSHIHFSTATSINTTWGWCICALVSPFHFILP